MALISVKIDKNVKLPELTERGGYKYPFEKMEKGHSFFIPTTCEKRLMQNRITNSAVAFIKRCRPTWKFTIRVMEDGVRCWRIK